MFVFGCIYLLVKIENTRKFNRDLFRLEQGINEILYYIRCNSNIINTSTCYT